MICKRLLSYYKIIMSKIIIFIVLLGCLSECAEENLRVPDEP